MKRVRIDKSAHSESSKRSVGHEFLGEYYEDIHYKCSKCERPAVFTALEQKEAFEIRKEYMWARRVLCTDCFFEAKAIQKEVENREKQYLENKEAILKDEEFLRDWLDALQEYGKYGRKKDESRIRFLQKHLENT